MFDWPVAATLLGVLGTICVGLYQFGPRGRRMEQTMCPDEEQQFHQLQIQVGNLQSDVKVLQSEQARNNLEITQLRGELAEIRRMLMEHLPR